MKGKKVLSLLVTLFLLAITSIGWAEYPDKPITIVVPFGVGGSSDLCFRALTGELAKVLKVPVNVVNRTGAGGLVGTDAVANSKPDGYTILGTSSAPMTVAVAYDPKSERDLDPLAIVAYQVNAFTTRTESEFKTLEDLVAYAKKHPGDVTCGSSGIQTEPFLNLAIFNSVAGVNIKHIGIASSSEGITNVLGGHVHLWSGSLSTSYSLMKGGRIRALAFTGNKRVGEFPDVPTFAEKGYPQANVSMVIILGGPKGLPPNVIKVWQDALKLVLGNSEVAAALNKLNYTIDLQVGTERLRKQFKEEAERFAKVYNETGTRK